MTKTILISLIFLLCGGVFSCKEKRDAFTIRQMYYWYEPEWYSRYDSHSGWYLSTVVKKGDDLIKQYGILTDQPDTIKAKHIAEAMAYIEYFKKTKDTTIYIK